jgi:hypothetical protein
MIPLWFVLLFLWFLAVVFTDVSISTMLWFFLLFLWVGVVVHYVIIYHGWKKEIAIRREERKEHLENGNASSKN